MESNFAYYSKANLLLVCPLHRWHLFMINQITVGTSHSSGYDTVEEGSLGFNGVSRLMSYINGKRNTFHETIIARHRNNKVYASLMNLTSSSRLAALVIFPACSLASDFLWRVVTSPKLQPRGLLGTLPRTIPKGHSRSAVLYELQGSGWVGLSSTDCVISSTASWKVSP